MFLASEYFAADLTERDVWYIMLGVCHPQPAFRFFQICHCTAQRRHRVCSTICHHWCCIVQNECQPHSDFSAMVSSPSSAVVHFSRCEKAWTALLWSLETLEITAKNAHLDTVPVDSLRASPLESARCTLPMSWSPHLMPATFFLWTADMCAKASIPIYQLLQLLLWCYVNNYESLTLFSLPTM